MRALQFSAHGGPEVLEVGKFPTPEPVPGHVVVELQASALNHLDLFVLRGLPGLTLPLPHVGGADGAGRVAAVGADVPGWSEGDEVVFNPGLWCGQCEYCSRGDESLCADYGILGEHAKGTFAEYVSVPAAALARKPGYLSWDEAAAFPLTYLTAWRMLTTRAGLKPGESVLIHGIGGGVALAAMEIAKRLGATVVVTSSSEDKLARARELGADATINYRSNDVAKTIRSLTGKRGVDVVVETTGERTWMSSLRSASRGGRIVTCGATTGPNPAEEIRLIFWNQLSILGSTMGSRADWHALIEAVTAWKLRPVVDSVWPLHEGRRAFERMAAGEQFGKIVLSVAASGERKGV